MVGLIGVLHTGLVPDPLVVEFDHHFATTLEVALEVAHVAFLDLRRDTVLTAHFVDRRYRLLRQHPVMNARHARGRVFRGCQVRHLVVVDRPAGDLLLGQVVPGRRLDEHRDRIGAAVSVRSLERPLRRVGVRVADHIACRRGAPLGVAGAVVTHVRGRRSRSLRARLVRRGLGLRRRCRRLDPVFGFDLLLDGHHLLLDLGLLGGHLRLRRSDVGRRARLGRDARCLGRSAAGLGDRASA